MARPNTYNFELCKEICEKVANGGHVIEVLESDSKYPSWSTFRHWKNDNEELQTLYTYAIKDKTEALTLEINAIMKDMKTGTIDPPTGRVLIDTLKWFSAKFYPKMYGDKVDVTSDNKPLQANIINVLTPAQIKEAIENL